MPSVLLPGWVSGSAPSRLGPRSVQQRTRIITLTIILMGLIITWVLLLPAGANLLLLSGDAVLSASELLGSVLSALLPLLRARPVLPKDAREDRVDVFEVVGEIEQAVDRLRVEEPDDFRI